MKKSLLSIATASMFLAGVGLAVAQSETPSEPTWASNQGAMMTQYSTSQKYTSFRDPNMKPVIGMELPTTVKLYALPDTMKSPTSSRYEYGMINDHPVVVESTSRKIVHTWD
jgi:Protein of unknown function (DUF1236)